MDSILRWGLIFIAIFVVLLIFYDVWFRRASAMQRKNELPMNELTSEPSLNSDLKLNELEDEPTLHINLPQPKKEEQVADANANDIIIISVLAKPGASFASYNLLQAISATGMQFGEMDIFHYYESTESQKTPLFSLASATKPGKFDLDRMGDFSCHGLSLFMDKSTLQHPEQVFLTMLEKAEQLAEDLDGELRSGPERSPWNEQILEQYINAM
jgi:cell division protein ZipA